MEAPMKLILSLLGEAPRAYDHASLQIAAGDQLPDEETGHDGFARSGVIREQETQRLPGQHGLIDGGDLVRQGLDQRRMYSHHRVKQVRKADAKRLRHQSEEAAVSIEAPRPSFLNHLYPGLVVPIEQYVGHMAFRVLICKFYRVRTVPPGPDHGYQAIGADAAHRRIGQKFLKSTHRSCPTYLQVDARRRLSRRARHFDISPSSRKNL